MLNANEYHANESWDYSSLGYRYISCIKCGDIIIVGNTIQLAILLHS